MARFTKIPESAFDDLQINAGILLSEFNPATPGDAASIIGNIICATTGGITFHATPTFADYGEDIDNCPKNMMELKRLQEWSIVLSGTGITIDPASAKRAVGAADISDGTITPRSELTNADFIELWFVGDYSSKNGETNGGYIAVRMLNTLSTGGFQWKSNDKAKGQFPFEYTAHYSMADQTQIPFEIYIKEGVDEA